MIRFIGFSRCAVQFPVPALLALTLLSACAGTVDSTDFDFVSQPIVEADIDAANLLTPPFDLGAGFPAGLAVNRDSDLLKEGQPAPVFEMEFSNGTRISTKNLAGRALVINFWATWCGPCRHEIPIILEKQAQYPDDLLVLAVNVKEDREKVENFASQFGMNIPVILDPPGSIVRLFKVRGYPTSIFINANGELVATWQGVLDAAKLEELVNASLAIDVQNS